MVDIGQRRKDRSRRAKERKAAAAAAAADTAIQPSAANNIDDADDEPSANNDVEGTLDDPDANDESTETNTVDNKKSKKPKRSRRQIQLSNNYLTRKQNAMAEKNEALKLCAATSAREAEEANRNLVNQNDKHKREIEKKDEEISALKKQKTIDWAGAREQYEENVKEMKKQIKEMNKKIDESKRLLEEAILAKEKIEKEIDRLRKELGVAESQHEDADLHEQLP